MPGAFSPTGLRGAPWGVIMVYIRRGVPAHSRPLLDRLCRAGCCGSVGGYWQLLDRVAQDRVL